MRQLTLAGSGLARPRFETFITRKGGTLVIPEGLATIPCTHGIHRFPGKFIPNIPRYIIREVLPEDESRRVFDPFCGSGTTLVEAALEGRQFVGADLDPLSVLISKAKTNLIPARELSEFSKVPRTVIYSTEATELVPEVKNLSHWFAPSAARELSAIKKRCLELPEPTRTFALVVFSSIIRRVSKADDQTQKTYVSHTLAKKAPAPHDLFPIFVQRAVRGMEEYSRLLPKPPSGIVLRSDARHAPVGVDFDDVVTSPPYVDSIEYVYNQMLEYYWLAPELGLESLSRIRATQYELMGFRPPAPELDTAALGREFFPTLRSDFESACATIQRASPKEERRVAGFFADYAEHVGAVRARQERGSLYVSVIGNSVVRGITVPTVEIIRSIHETLGYELQDQFGYDIRRHYMKFPRRANSGKIGRDNILIFRAA
jgi:SAM-dependent methyltransferase